LKPWILVSLCNDRQEYQRLQAADARAAAARAGLDAKLVYSEIDPARQVQQLSEAVSGPEGSRPVALVVETAGSVGFERVARSALGAGVGWVQVSDSPRYLEALRREFPDRLVAATCYDNQEIGRTLARLALRALPSGGSLVVVEGPTATAGTLQRRRALEEGLRGSGLRAAKTLSADWTSAGGHKATEAWLRLTGKAAAKPDLLVAFNDEMAVGALAAIHAVRPDWGAIRAVGCDGLPESGQRLVREGVLAATVVTPTTTGPAVDLVARSMRGEQVPPVESIPTRPFPPIG
jgi:ABC-type sugar transport system substrate-binding protein